MGRFLEDKFSFRKFPVTIWYALLKSFRYGVLFVPAWVASVGWVVCLRGWCASVDKVGNVLAWLAH